ncbi:MAG: site-specific integrase [Acidihalobacter sp.]|uniref:site-specific integrase n=1 Tax=Acidihalobacter sp. TaxID=1872108 RepID=UPI00307E151D
MATITQLSSGKWQAKIRRQGYPARGKTFLRREDAAAWARAQESEMDRGVWRDRTSAETTTLYALLKRYAKDVVPSQKGSETAALRVRTLMGDSISQYRLAALTPLVLAEWRDRRLAAGAKGSTINRELNILSAVFNWARRELMIQVENPVSGIRRPKDPPARNRRLEGDEEVRLLTALEDHSAENEREDGKCYRRGTKNPYMRPLVLLALETAMRRGELLSLTWPHVDLRRRVVHLPDTKNGEPRDVPLSSRAVAVLEDLKTKRDEQQKAEKVTELRRTKPVDDRVFPVTPNALKLSWARATRRAGLDDLHFHDLRHEATSRLAEKVPNLIELAAITGHKDLRMLKRYYHPRAEDLAVKLG